jgi:hypothetical protein
VSTRSWIQSIIWVKVWICRFIVIGSLNWHTIFMVWSFWIKLFSHSFYDVLLLQNVKHLNIDFQLFLLFKSDKKDGYCKNSSGSNAAETARNINVAFGEGSANECTVRFWFKRFRNGSFDLKNKSLNIYTHVSVCMNSRCFNVWDWWPLSGDGLTTCRPLDFKYIMVIVGKYLRFLWLSRKKTKFNVSIYNLCAKFLWLYTVYQVLRNGIRDWHDV